MKRFLSNKINHLVICVCCVLMFMNASAQTTSKPNIIVIYADDLGWNQLSCYGNTKIKTPNIDALAAQGVRFTQAYATAPICSPSRMGLLTGRYQQRFGAEFLVPELHPPVLNAALKEKINEERAARKTMFEAYDTAAYNKLVKGIPLTEKLLPQFMKEQGYATGAIGKWHAGEQEGLQPWKRGFDYYYGTLTWGTIYASVKDPNILTKSYYYHTMNSEDTARHGSINIVRNGVVVNEKEYITDRFAEEAVNFIDKNKSKPFFLYLPFTAVHDPFQAKKSDFDAITTGKDTTERIYLAILKSLDDAVGKVMAKLKEDGLDKNTLIFFGSDNGGASYSGQMTNAPLRGGKQSDFEGGIRVPLIIKYPGVIKEGLVYNKPVSNLDIFATAINAVKAKLPTGKVYDGKNIVPFVNGDNNNAPHPVLFWRSGYSKAIRKGDWKLYTNERAHTTLLYNMADDYQELHDLSNSNQQKVKELLGDLKAWESQLHSPLWPFTVSELPADIKSDYPFYFPI